MLHQSFKTGVFCPHIKSQPKVSSRLNHVSVQGGPEYAAPWWTKFGTRSLFGFRIALLVDFRGKGASQLPVVGVHESRMKCDLRPKVKSAPLASAITEGEFD